MNVINLKVWQRYWFNIIRSGPQGASLRPLRPCRLLVTALSCYRQLFKNRCKTEEDAAENTKLLPKSASSKLELKLLRQTNSILKISRPSVTSERRTCKARRHSGRNAVKLCKTRVIHQISIEERSPWLSSRFGDFGEFLAVNIKAISFIIPLFLCCIV